MLLFTKVKLIKNSICMSTVSILTFRLYLCLHFFMVKNLTMVFSCAHILLNVIILVYLLPFFLLLCQEAVWIAVSKEAYELFIWFTQREFFPQIPQVFAILNEKEARRKRRIQGQHPTSPSLLSFLLLLSFPLLLPLLSSGSDASVPEFKETVPGSCADTHAVFWDTGAAYPVVMAR